MNIDKLIEAKIDKKITEIVECKINDYFTNDFEIENNTPIDEKDINLERESKSTKELLKNDAEKYLKDLEHGIQMLRRNGHDGGIIKLFNDEDVSEENNKYLKYMASLTWDELDNLCMNNANIDMNGIYGDEECDLLKHDGNPIVTCHNIIKNSLYKKLAKIIEINYDNKSKDIINVLLMKELAEYLDTFIDTVIEKYGKEIFDSLFGKIYLEK